jgi:acetylornithine/succinyldiaminopimelate/putrescine aminotransferase
MFVKGEGVYLWDVENRKYLDFTAGIAVNALGHCDPEIAQIMAQQVSWLTPPTLTTLTHLSTKGQNPPPHLEPLP